MALVPSIIVVVLITVVEIDESFESLPKSRSFRFALFRSRFSTPILVVGDCEVVVGLTTSVELSGD